MAFRDISRSLSLFSSSSLRPSTTRGVMRQVLRGGSDLRSFSRAPLGRASLQIANMLTKWGTQDASASGNRASQIGWMNQQTGNFLGSSTVMHLLDGLLNQALSRQKTTVTRAESERSQTVAKLWNSSRSERDAALSRILQRGLAEK